MNSPMAATRGMPVEQLEPQTPRPAWMMLEGLGVWLVMFFSAGWPVPDPNEPHYLAKAKHFWQPDWLANDMFVSSPDAHQVFCVVFGWLTLWFSLPVVAWIGRVLTWSLQAWAWRRLSWSIAPRPGLAVLSMALFLALNEHWQMAGEWVVGGFEAKGIAYALVFLALERMLNNRWNQAWVFFGLASAFHVLVGGWSALAAMFAYVWGGKEKPNLSSMTPGLLFGGLFAAAGVVPGMMLSWNAPAAIVTEANLAYFMRVYHHLDIFAFKPAFVFRFVLLIVGTVMLFLVVPPGTHGKRLRVFVVGAMLISLCGLGITLATNQQPALAAKLLRYYWFRLSDVAVPIGAALTLIQFVYLSYLGHKNTGRRWLFITIALALWYVVPTLPRPWHPTPRADKPGKVADLARWKDVCSWIKIHMPEDEMFLTPRTCQTFKWYAQRSELATWKDIPQNPRGLVIWQQRLKDVYAITDPESERQWFGLPSDLPPERLVWLSRKYGFRFIVTEKEDPLPFDVIYSNEIYAVYHIYPTEWGRLAMGKIAVKEAVKEIAERREIAERGATRGEVAE